eukprot:480671-Pyramimonas_sp.AAC.1
MEQEDCVSIGVSPAQLMLDLVPRWTLSTPVPNELCAARKQRARPMSISARSPAACRTHA